MLKSQNGAVRSPHLPRPAAPPAAAARPRSAPHAARGTAPRPVPCAHSPTPHDPGGTRSSSSTVSPPSYTDTVPDEAEITTGVALVTVGMASAAARRAPSPRL